MDHGNLLNVVCNSARNFLLGSFGDTKADLTVSSKPKTDAPFQSKTNAVPFRYGHPYKTPRNSFNSGNKA